MIFPGIWLDAILKQNGNICPNENCQETFSALPENKAQRQIRAATEEVSVECPHCKEEQPFNSIFEHMYQHQLTERPCKYCKNSFKGQEKQKEHHQKCKNEELECERCGTRYKREVKENHVCPTHVIVA